MPEVRVPFNGWLPRPHQSALWEHLQAGGKRAVAIWHRRAGKDEICLHHAACSAISRPGNYWHCLPEFLQGRKAIWTAVNANTGKRRIDEAFPPAIRETTNDNEMFIRFVNGSTWQIIGSDRYDATVGAGTAGITYSEWALANPSAWAYHRPMLEENNGWAAFITTPRGRNHALAMFNHASGNPNWFCERLTALDTRALSSDQLEEALAEYMALYGEDVGRAQFQQEYMCFPGSALVVCHDRAKPIADIRPGDSVLTHTGRFRRVERIMQREYVGPMVRIEAYGSPDLVCTPEHPVYVCDPLSQTYRWVEAKNVTAADWLVTPRMDLRQAPLIAPDLATVIAWYVSDGCVSGNAVTFSIGTHKEDCIADLRAALTGLGYEAAVTPAGGVTNVTINAVGFADFLVAQCGSLAHNKRLPLALLRGNERVVWEALFRGDGHIRRREGHNEFAYLCVSEGLMHQLVVLGAALGYAGKINSRDAHERVIEGRAVNCREAWQVHLSRSTAHDNRTNGKLRSAKNGMLGRVRAVSTEDYAGSLHNIEVAGDNSYTVNGRAVHNCDWNAAILGAFYALEMARVRNEERIIEIEAIPDVPVHRAWDLGVTDDTSIWWFQAVGSQLFILDHLSTSGVGVEFYRDEIVKRANTYGWRHGMDYVPHDAKVKEWGSGRTRIETMRDLGLNPQPVPNVSIEDGRNAIRRTLPLCVFHPRTEEGGISALEQHRREWDDEKKAFRANAVHDWTSHACLTGEMLIATPDGAVPIREIRIGDMVSTPNGPARVMAGGPTKHADELIEIELADGRALTGTPQHKVFTERGLISLAEIDQSDVILAEKSALWCRTQSYSMAENTGFRDAIIAVTTGERAVRRTCTVRSGSLQTVLFRKVLTFITRTVAAPITNYPILSLSSIASTPSNIRWSALPAVKFPRSANSHTNGQPNGMPRRKDWHGTQGTAAPPGTSGNGIVAFARSAIASSCRRIQHAPSSVISIARWRPCDVGAESPLVYDLTVEKQHCYLANGILVSNSDAFRYLALSWRPTERRIAKEKPRLPDAWIIPPPTEPNRRGIVL